MSDRLPEADGEEDEAECSNGDGTVSGYLQWLYDAAKGSCRRQMKPKMLAGLLMRYSTTVKLA